MKRLSIVILAVLLALATLLASSCDAPPSEAQGEKGDNPAKGTESTTDVPDTTDGESTGDSGTAKEEATTFPENSDSSNDETSAEDATEPDDTDADAESSAESTGTEAETPPEAEPVAPPSEELLVLIENDYSAFCNSDGRTYLTRYYGEYSDCVPVMFLEPIPGVIMDIDIEVAGSVFHYTDPIEITVWKDGEFYTLQEAYDQNLLTKEQIATIASIHSSGEFVPLNRY